MKNGITACGRSYGQGLGGVQRKCRKYSGHDGLCSDMPYLTYLKITHRKVAEKIERDSFQTRGASWGRDTEGRQSRRNRQPRWTLKPGDSFYPRHHQTYEVCLAVAAELTIQAYEMVEAPVCPPEISCYLPRTPIKGSGICRICRLPMEFDDFSEATQSLAAIDTDHLDPALERRHVPHNVSFVHHICNTTKGDRSVDGFIDWMIDVLERFGIRVDRAP